MNNSIIIDNLSLYDWFLYELFDFFDLKTILIFSQLSKKINSIWIPIRDSKILTFRLQFLSAIFLKNNFFLIEYFFRKLPTSSISINDFLYDFDNNDTNDTKFKYNFIN